MAIPTVCSSPTHSPTLPAISALKTHHPLPPQITVSSSSTKFGADLVSNDALVIAAAAEAVALARAASQAAREAALAAAEARELWSGGESDNLLVSGTSGVTVRRRKIRSLVDKNGVTRRCPCCSVETRRLSGREEAELCLSLKEGTRLEAARRKITEDQGSEPTSKQLAKAVGTKRSVQKIMCDGRESGERIARTYRRLVISIAKNYQGKGLSFRELVQEGSIGLLRGAEKFEPERGYKLSTYVYWWIKQAMAKAANDSRVVRLPGHICRMVARIAEATNLLSKRLGRLPTHWEIAQMLDVHVSTVKLVSERSRPPISLDQAVTDRGPMTLQSIISGPDETMPETLVKKQLKKQVVEKLLKTLDEREERILRLRFGLNGEPPQSCEDIGRQLKLSRERIRQIKIIALSKLQQMDIAADIEFYVV